MRETPFAREDAWMNVVGPLAAKPVKETVAPLIGDAVALRPEIPGLAEIAGSALQSLGLANAGIRTISEASPGEFLRELPENARRFVELRPNDLLARAIDWRMLSPLDEQLAATMADALASGVDRERTTRLKGRLWIELYRRPSLDARNGLGELGGMILQARWSVAFHLAAFVMARKVALQPPLRSLLELFRLGNAPIGTLADGTFLIVTA